VRFDSIARAVRSSSFRVLEPWLCDRRGLQSSAVWVGRGQTRVGFYSWLVFGLSGSEAAVLLAGHYG